jgi:hypothetical protein
MMWFEELKSNILALWGRIDQRQRTGAVVAIAAILVVAIGVGYWSLHTSYEVLFADLDERDAGNIVAELKQSKTPYRLSDDGHRILVPDSLVYETRLRLMGKGVLLNGGVGFEIFDNKDLGMTEYTQKINYQRHHVHGTGQTGAGAIGPCRVQPVQTRQGQAQGFREPGLAAGESAFGGSDPWHPATGGRLGAGIGCAVGDRPRPKRGDIVGIGGRRG